MKTTKKTSPDVIFIGYQKSGTEFLRSYFSQHPDVAWTRHAEMFHHNIPDAEMKRQYLDNFTAGSDKKSLIDMYEGVALGYFYRGVNAWRPEVFARPDMAIDGIVAITDPDAMADRVKSVVPEARILITIRNQVDWLRSGFIHYQMHLPDRRKGFADFLATVEGKNSLHAALYDDTIRTYRERFGADGVKVVLLEQMRDEEEATLQDICGFLGVDYIKFPEEVRQYNRGRGNSMGNLTRMASRIGISDEMFSRIAPKLRFAKGPVLNLMDRDVLDEKEIVFLRSFYSVSNHRTSRMLGIDLGKYGYPL